MRFVIFTHSLVSDWNHGNAHFLRGFATELMARGHEVRMFEPRNGWSRRHLLEAVGARAVDDFHSAYPKLRSTFYDEAAPDLDSALHRADVAIVHEWNDPELVNAIGRHHARHPQYRLLFHDTHHRSLTDRSSIAQYDLSNYDGVLAYGRVIRDTYLTLGWAGKAWVWHEAADTRVFRPMRPAGKDGDLVWIGNWGDDERADSIREFLIEPVKKLGLRAHVYGVRYPEHAIAELTGAGIEYRGWLPNYRVPEVFSRYKVTVHIPRKPYVEALPGIPTIRVFEALACSIPLISTPWCDSESLFRTGDFVYAHNGAAMCAHLRELVDNPSARDRVARRGLETVLTRHTCSHRVDELLEILAEQDRILVSEVNT